MIDVVRSIDQVPWRIAAQEPRDVLGGVRTRPARDTGVMGCQLQRVIVPVRRARQSRGPPQSRQERRSRALAAGPASARR